MESNDRLEFLGDAVLGMLVAEELYRANPFLSEGSLIPSSALRRPGVRCGR